jgi:hypothetical protein
MRRRTDQRRGRSAVLLVGTRVLDREPAVDLCGRQRAPGLFTPAAGLAACLARVTLLDLYAAEQGQPGDA